MTCRGVGTVFQSNSFHECMSRCVCIADEKADTHPHHNSPELRRLIVSLEAAMHDSAKLALFCGSTQAPHVQQSGGACWYTHVVHRPRRQQSYIFTYAPENVLLCWRLESSTDDVPGGCRGSYREVAHCNPQAPHNHHCPRP
jgi:hypothetical protein